MVEYGGFIRVNEHALEDYESMTFGNLDSVLVQLFAALCWELKIAPAYI